MVRDQRRDWLNARRRRIARQFRVHFLAKLWVRSKRLRDFKTTFLRQTLPRTPRSRRPLRPTGDNEIRILRLESGTTLSTIRCKFMYVDLRDAKDYAALSYTWGTAAPSIPILLQGKVKLVSENLYLALLHLRKRGVTWIWIDALCINQEDLAERARQVSHMDEVYRRASLVWVWLGDSDKFSELALDELHDLGQQLDWDEIVPQDLLVQELKHRPERWRAISELLYRPWFRRMWIIQEVLSAQRAMMICGKDVIDMDLFLKVIYSFCRAELLKSVLAFHTNRHELLGGPLKVAHVQLSFFVKAKFEVTDYLARHRFKKTLLNFMAETRWAEATNPLDKIYGVFGLASDARSLSYWHYSEGERSPRRSLEVDYTLSKEELFIQVTKAIICTSGSLEILRFARYEPNSTSDLPSWVADWATPTPHSVPHYLPVESIDRDNSHSWRPDRRVAKDCEEAYTWSAIQRMISKCCGPRSEIRQGNTLTLTGMHIDTVARLTSQSIPNDHDLYSDPHDANTTEAMAKRHNFLGMLKDWSEECVQHAQTCDPYPTGQSASSVLWSVLNGYDTRTEDQIPHSCFALPEVIDDLQAAVGVVGKQLQSKHDDTLSDVLGSVALSNFRTCLSRLPKMSETCFGQKFATTEKRHMGLVPDGAKAGDLLCLIYGCETPVVLRGCDGGRFRLIGHSKLHGFDFDKAVVESTFTLRKGAKNTTKKYTFQTWDENGRAICTLLKETRNFILV